MVQTENQVFEETVHFLFKGPNKVSISESYKPDQKLKAIKLKSSTTEEI